MEMVDRVQEIQHAGVRGCLEFLEIYDGIEVNHAGDLPARSGLGSSSAFTVGMLNALQVLTGKKPDRGTLANQAIAVEQIVLKETVGVQDQIECAWGGLNIISIDKDGSYNVQPIVLSEDNRSVIEDHLVLVFTDLQRYASEIAKTQIDNMDQQLNTMHNIMSLIPEAIQAIHQMDLKRFGELLHETWMLKRDLSNKISNPKIDQVYEIARKAGAYGGKLLGAGGGGFLLLCIPPEKRDKVLKEVGLLSVPFKFENYGSQLVLDS